MKRIYSKPFSQIEDERGLARNTLQQIKRNKNGKWKQIIRGVKDRDLDQGIDKYENYCERLISKVQEFTTLNFDRDYHLAKWLVNNNIYKAKKKDHNIGGVSVTFAKSLFAIREHQLSTRWDFILRLRKIIKKAGIKDVKY